MTNKNLSDKSNDKLADELPLRILIAEDNVINQKLLLNILAILGYKAEAVADGLDVLRSLNEKKIDLVLMDIQMPEMGGEETTRLIRERFTDNAPKIIAITAYAMAGDREKYLKAGMDGYIAKPFKMADLVAELRRVMSAKE
ncbi:MAG: response regulator [Chitinophagales bacterium]|nr:response regulator [Chitinophagales bacterium]